MSYELFLQQLAEAEPLARKAVEGQRRLSGDEAHDTLYYKDTLAVILHQQGKLTEAETLFQSIVKLGPHPEVRMNYGRCLTDLGRYEDAEKHLLAGYQTYNPTKRSWDIRTRKTLEGLITLYEARDAAEPGQGYAEKAAEYRALLPAGDDSDTSETPTP